MPDSATQMSPQQQRFEFFLGTIDRISHLFHLDPGQIVNLEQIQALPRGTLGRELSEFLHREQLKPFTTGHRRKQLHDAVHVLTGYGTDLVGEAELQAFLLGSGGFNPLNALLQRQATKLIIAKHLLSPEVLHQRLTAAYQRGQASTFHPDHWQIETQWPLPLSQVREQFGVGNV